MPGIRFEFKDGVNIEFGVVKLPNRRNPALYKMRGANADILAYFRSQEDADAFSCLLDYLIERTSRTPPAAA